MVALLLASALAVAADGTGAPPLPAGEGNVATPVAMPALEADPAASMEGAPAAEAGASDLAEAEAAVPAEEALATEGSASAPAAAVVEAAASRPAPLAAGGAAPAEVRAVVPPAPRDDRAILGVALDAGVPSGAGASILVQALPWLRVHGGGATNGAGFGLRGGATFTPLHFFLAPTLGVEAGHFFEGDGTRLAKYAGPLPSYGANVLETVHYDYASAHAGLEIGSPDGFFFYARGGLGYVRSRIHGLTEALEGTREGVRFEVGGPRVTAVIPSASFGFALFVL